MLSRKNSPLGKNRSKKDPYLVFSSVSELKSHPLFAHLGEEWTKNEELFYMKIEKKVKQPTACQNRNGEMFRGVGNIGGTPKYIYRIEYWWLPLTTWLYNKQKILIKCKAKWFVFFIWGGFGWYRGSLLNIMMVSKNILP